MTTKLQGDAVSDRLYSAVIADVLDRRGLRDQALDEAIRPLEPSTRVFGRAHTVLARSCSEVAHEPYRKELEAVDELRRGDVLVASVLGDVRAAFWGELLTIAAVSRGARGAVIDGLTRDSAAIGKTGFSVFLRGYCPLDSKGRADVTSSGEPIECGGVRVEAGDYIFGDRDGVVVIPSAIAPDVLDEASVKALKETEMRRALRQGMDVIAAYEEFGVL